MADHNELGKKAELLAISYLLGKGYEILFTNWRKGRYEIDIVGMKDGLLRVVEVKARKYYPGSFPEQAITKMKYRNLVRAAEEFLIQQPQYRDLRFEVLSITFPEKGEPDYFLIQDVVP